MSNASREKRSRDDDPFQHYVTTIRLLPKLERDQELELFRRWRTSGDARAKGELLVPHLRAVVAIALKYRRYGVPLEELVSEGNLGLVYALSKYDPARGTRFMTYASFWVRAYVLDHVIESYSLVGGGAGPLRSKLFFKLRRERARVVALLGEGEEADRVLAERLGMPTDAVQSMLRRLEARDVSLDAPASNDASRSLLDTLPSHEPSHDDSLAERQDESVRREACRRALETLDVRERFVVRERLMADDEDERSLAEIGRQLGVSRERARQLEKRAKQKLRQNLAREASRPGLPSVA